MLDFSYCNPTRLVFGRGSEAQIGSLVAQQVGVDNKVLVVYGGGSAKRSGLLDGVTASLRAAGLDVFEKGGVQPNPRLSFIKTTAEEHRSEAPAAVIAVGGGSVIDTAKGIALMLADDPKEDVWDFFTGARKATKALPVYAVLTIPAAGSEQSIRAVITHGETKTGVGTECIRPKAAFINPERFATLPRTQIGAGLVDMCSHIMERYFSATEHTDYVDGQAEAAMRTIIETAPKVYADPSDYDAWCQAALAGSFAHNGYFGMGREEDWACHAIEHAISGWRESITHGAGLAVVIPAWMRYVSALRPVRFEAFAVKVMGVAPQDTTERTIALGIAKFSTWAASLGMPLTLEDLGAKDCPVEELAKRCCGEGTVGKILPLAAADVAAILESAR